MTIRPGGKADLAAIDAVQRQSPGAALWPPQEYMQYELTVVEVEGDLAAFIVYRQVDAGVWELLNLAVKAECRRQGIARQLLQKHAGSRVYLEVRESNTIAIALYEACGLRRIAERKYYYTGPVESAIVMEL